MTISVLLDTSFLITLTDKSRDNHDIAHQYYKYLLEQNIPIYFSVIVAAEFLIKQPITDLPLRDFRILPFNLKDSIEASRIGNLLGRPDPSDDRAVFRDDIKIIAQALCEQIPFILTADAKTFYKYCERLRINHNESIRAILIDGFDSSLLSLDGQTSLEKFSNQ